MTEMDLAEVSRRQVELLVDLTQNVVKLMGELYDFVAKHAEDSKAYFEEYQHEREYLDNVLLDLKAEGPDEQ